MSKLPATSRRTVNRLRRRGVILYVTMMVVLMAGLLAAGLSFYIRSQAAGDSADSNGVQALEAARAGVALASAILMDERLLDANLSDDAELFGNVAVAAGQPGWYVSLMRDPLTDEGGPVFGLTDEAGKLNLNTATEVQLLCLPGMTPQVAQAILDWRDRDDRASPEGAENEHYLNLPVPYAAKNGPFESVDELLLVRGVTERMVYGEDMNRNGVLDPNEDDGDQSLPPDNGDGKLDRGWYAYLTVYTIQPNQARDGASRLNINTTAPAELYDKMKEMGFSEELATFVRTARQGGVTFRHPSELLGWQGKVRVGGGGSTGGGRFGGRGPGGSGGGGNEVELASPLGEEELPAVLDKLSARPQPRFIGLVNPAAAAKVVLEAVGFTAEEAQNAISVRSNLAPSETRTCAWLASKRVLTPERFRELAPRLIGLGWQFRVDAVGHSKRVGLFRRIETVIDLSTGKPRLIYSRELTGLGPAFVLDAEGGQSLMGRKR